MLLIFIPISTLYFQGCSIETGVYIDAGNNVDQMVVADQDDSYFNFSANQP